MIRTMVARGLMISAMGSAAWSSWAQQPPDTSDLMARRLPKPTIAAGELPRPCAKRYSEVRLEYATPRAQARAEADGFLGAGLQRWAEMYFHPKGALCLDFPFVVRKFQETGGAPPTGLLSEADVDRLVAARIGGREDQAAMAQQQVTAAAAAQVARQNAPQVFGIPMGVPLELPMCGQVLVGRPPPQTCQSIYNEVFGGQFVQIHFSSADKPGWVSGSLVVKFVGPDVAELEFTPTSLELARRAFTEKFGPPAVDSVPMHNDVGGQWTAERQTWQGQGLAVTIGCGFSSMGVCPQKLSIVSLTAAARARERRQRQNDETLEQGRKL